MGHQGKLTLYLSDGSRLLAGLTLCLPIKVATWAPSPCSRSVASRLTTTYPVPPLVPRYSQRNFTSELPLVGSKEPTEGRERRRAPC